MFIIGTEYSRSELLAYVGSKQAQSGIIWGQKRSDCIIVTSGGKHSKEAGYQDERRPDGSWIYFGQGAHGDQNPNRFANKLLIDQERSVLLFSAKEPSPAEIKANGSLSKRYRYEGIYNVLSWEVFIPRNGVRAGDKLLRFHLVPPPDLYQIDSLGEKSSVAVVEDANFLQVREITLRYGSVPAPIKQTLQEYRQASNLIKKYARLRADGICECCGKPAPFVDAYGTPYLEVHHIFRLADDGPDNSVNVAAICPNCHREAHFGYSPEKFRELLAAKIRAKEQILEKAKQ